MRKLWAGLLVSTACLVSLSAEAQVWLKDRASRSGPGFKLGDYLVLHLGAGLEGGYDTNALHRSEEVEGSWRLRVTPYVDLATRPPQRRATDEGSSSVEPQKISFTLGLAGFYDHFFSEVKPVSDQSDFGADGHLSLTLFPSRPFSATVNMTYRRDLELYESSEDAHAKHIFRPGLTLKYRPGGGSLGFSLGYRMDYLMFEDDLLAEQDDKHRHDVRLEINWKVFPKTALVSRTMFAPVVYAGDTTINVNSMPVRSLVGVQGLVTDRFGLTLLVGYGASFYDAGPNYDSVIANAELMFFVTPFSKIRVGGQRDFVDSLYANYYEKDGGYLSWEQIFGGVFLIGLKGEVFYRGYSEFAGTAAGNSLPTHAERNDIWVAATLFPEWRATDWLSVFASARYMGDITDFGYQTASADPSTGQVTVTTYDVGFHKFVAFLGVRGHY